jgi:hypothetical protein
VNHWHLAAAAAAAAASSSSSSSSSSASASLFEKESHPVLRLAWNSLCIFFFLR